MEAILTALFFIIGGGLIIGAILMFVDMLLYALTGKSLQERWSDDDDTFQIEDDLHAIRQHLDRLEEMERPEPEKPADRYAGMTDKELRRQAEEADRKMKQMR